MHVGSLWTAAAVAATALTAGCAVSLVTRPGSPAPAAAHASLDQSNRPGVVRYLNEGSQTVRLERRADARRTMQKACEGPFRIEREGDRMDGGVVVPSGVAALFSQSRYWFIQFSCVLSRPRVVS
jgi:hypothetical protein